MEVLSRCNYTDVEAPPTRFWASLGHDFVLTPLCFFAAAVRCREQLLTSVGFSKSRVRPQPAGPQHFAMPGREPWFWAWELSPFLGGVHRSGASPKRLQFPVNTCPEQLVPRGTLPCRLRCPGPPLQESSLPPGGTWWQKDLIIASHTRGLFPGGLPRLGDFRVSGW